MILLDANVLIWWLTGDERLGKKSLGILESPKSNLRVSIFTVFEIELKASTSIGKLKLPSSVSEVLDKLSIPVYSPTPFEIPEILLFQTKHGDPFDRVVIGLASLKGWKLMTSDKNLISYNNQDVVVIDSRE